MSNPTYNVLGMCFRCYRIQIIDSVLRDDAAINTIIERLQMINPASYSVCFIYLGH